MDAVEVGSIMYGYDQARVSLWNIRFHRAVHNLRLRPVRSRRRALKEDPFRLLKGGVTGEEMIRKSRPRAAHFVGNFFVVSLIGKNMDVHVLAPSEIFNQLPRDPAGPGTAVYISQMNVSKNVHSDIGGDILDPTILRVSFRRRLFDSVELRLTADRGLELATCPPGSRAIEVPPFRRGIQCS